MHDKQDAAAAAAQRAWQRKHSVMAEFEGGIGDEEEDMEAAEAEYDEPEFM
jgi:hypothetical protein